jgi:response regulator RpfG family c-di-GMP phosphodiesterase
VFLVIFASAKANNFNSIDDFMNSTTKHISVVDNDEFTSSTLISELKRLRSEYKISSFNSAEEALPFILERSPEIVLFEYKLPGMTGIDFFEKISNLPSGKKTLIMMSSLDDGNMVLKFIQRGVRNYVIKDGMLVASINEIIEEEIENQ